MNALAPPLFDLPPDVCRACIFYSKSDGTCARSIAGFSKSGAAIHGYAKFARMDAKQCGPSAANFKAKHAQPR